MLSVEAVSKTFGGVQALRQASLSCATGEILGLIGRTVPASPRSSMRFPACFDPMPAASGWRIAI
ncbi:hypothetical protein [Mesorhizobium amorphae]|uniref:hypothetical protein n=1 Tax=Mesorhizobium amorphae TaxID=71433 RepID=UPI0021B2EF3A|nr:hypothetical protein [Mesorhizobium amorphae]